MFHATRAYLISGAAAHSGICKQRTPVLFLNVPSLPHPPPSTLPLVRTYAWNVMANRSMKGQRSLRKRWKWKYREKKKEEKTWKNTWEKRVEYEFFSPKLWDLGFFFRQVNSLPGQKWNATFPRAIAWALLSRVELLFFTLVLILREFYLEEFPLFIYFFFFLLLNQKVAFANFKKIKIFSTYSIVLLVERCKTSKNGNIWFYKLLNDELFTG